MTNMICSELVLKAEKVGRVITPWERKEELMTEFERERNECHDFCAALRDQASDLRGLAKKTAGMAIRHRGG